MKRLHTAAKFASLEAVTYLLDSNESALSMPDNLMELPLHKSCREGRPWVIEYLMTKNMATVTVMNCWNELPLLILCNKRGKNTRRLKLVEYTDIIRTHPETGVVP